MSVNSLQTIHKDLVSLISSLSSALSDEFNRVIIPVKRGEENTDYVNASFIDVSVFLSHTPSAAFSAKAILPSI